MAGRIKGGLGGSDVRATGSGRWPRSLVGSMRRGGLARPLGRPVEVACRDGTDAGRCRVCGRGVAPAWGGGGGGGGDRQEPCLDGAGGDAWGSAKKTPGVRPEQLDRWGRSQEEESPDTAQTKQGRLRHGARAREQGRRWQEEAGLCAWTRLWTRSPYLLCAVTTTRLGLQEAARGLSLQRAHAPCPEGNSGPGGERCLVESGGQGARPHPGGARAKLGQRLPWPPGGSEVRGQVLPFAGCSPRRAGTQPGGP